MKIRLFQLKVTHDIAANKAKILSVIQNTAEKDEWLVFPEGALTGYFPGEEWYLKDISHTSVDAAIEEIRELVRSKQCHCLLGTARQVDGRWYNSVAIISAKGEVSYYDKVAVSELDKQSFSAGTELKTFEMDGVTFGIQICRELKFSDQWLKLKQQGAQIVFHADNAIKPSDAVWEHLIIARAVENRLFVASVNSCHEPGELASYLVNPAGEVLLRGERQKEQSLAAEIDLVN